LDLAFFLPHLQTGRTKMLAVQLTVAESAQEPAASLARDHGLLLRMIKATRFGVLQDRFARASGSKPPEERGKNFNLEPGTARGARRKIREVKQISEQRSLAFRARNQRRIHWGGLLAADDAGIANMIVEPALFTVECRHDVPDRTNAAAENFGKMPSERAKVGDATAVGRDHSKFTGHFAERSAVLSDHERLVGSSDGD